MQNTLSNNKNPHLSQNIFLNQPNQTTTKPTKQPAKKESRNVLQDKKVLTNTRASLLQPAVFKNGEQSRAFTDNKTPRTQNHTSRKKLIPATFHLEPLVYTELKRIAEREFLSLSQVGATACSEWMRYNIHKQHESVLIPILRQVMREELTAFGNRIVYFLLKIAFPAEQARILITNVLKWVVKLAGLDLKAYYNMIDEASSLARRNIIAKSPQTKDLMEKWEGMFTDEKREEQRQKGKGKEEKYKN
jgi:hypothetical protein